MKRGFGSTKPRVNPGVHTDVGALGANFRLVILPSDGSRNEKSNVGPRIGRRSLLPQWQLEAARL